MHILKYKSHTWYALKFHSISMLIIILFTACIADQGGLSNVEGESNMNAGTVSMIDETVGGTGEDSINDPNDLINAGTENSNAGEEQAGTDVNAGILAGEDQAGTSAGGTEAGTGNSGGNTFAGMESGTEMTVDPEPPSMELAACERFCERMDDCLYASCEAVQNIPLRQFCGGWCQNADDTWLNEGADLSCDIFNQRIFGFSPEIRTLCTQEITPDSCDGICDFGEVCGLVSSECDSNCPELSSRAQLCLLSAVDSQSCRRFAGCLQGRDGPPQGNELQGFCRDLCQREAQCIFNTCSPATLPTNFIEQCEQSCDPDGLNEQQLYERSQLSCEEVVVSARQDNPTIDMRCDADEADSCLNACSEDVLSCMNLNVNECTTLCEQWDRSNHICLATANSCGEIAPCFISMEEQERCRASCDYFQECLEEACPPRILPPQLTDSCTADCFEDPISEDDLQGWQSFSCAEVREVVYRDNEQLRPICEGNSDFRASPEECAAFCDEALGTCLIGGRTVCLAACSSLSRDQYQCALEAQGSCDLIDQCLY
jgi:hypothetical protein